MKKQLSIAAMREHFLPFAVEQGKRMMAPAQGCMQNAFLDPGGPYCGNLWDWDSYWAAVSLFSIANEVNDPEFTALVKEHARGSLLNFLQVQAPDGSLPIALKGENPDYFFSLTDPANNMAKPLQSMFLDLLLKNDAITPDEAQALLPQLRRAALCRKERYTHKPTGLLVWGNDVAIGVDDDPTVWGRPPLSSAHIYLNTFQAMELRAAWQLSERFNDQKNADFFRTEYENIVNAINNYLYDKRDQWYYTCDVLCQQRLIDHPICGTLNINLDTFWRVMPLRVRNFCGIMPLAANIASAEQASAIKNCLCDPAEFWSNYGIRSLSRAEDRFYDPQTVRGNPSNWLGPVWIISCYMGYLALKQYGFNKEANDLTYNTLSTLYNDMQTNGILHEYYHPETGQGISNPGFVSWNLLALCMDKQ